MISIEQILEVTVLIAFYFIIHIIPFVSAFFKIGHGQLSRLLRGKWGATSGT